MGFGVDLRGTVTDIRPCPALESGLGRLVLTTVNHLNNDVHELVMRDARGQEESLRVTGTHKFYSVSRGQ